MFCIHETFKPTHPTPGVQSAVRVIGSIDFKKVVLIELDGQAATPYRIDYEEWTELISTNKIERIADPFMALPSVVSNLPKAAMARYSLVNRAVYIFGNGDNSLNTGASFQRAIREIANELNIGEKTAQRWICKWLQAGRNPAAIVSKFISRTQKPTKQQSSGNKRGRHSYSPQLGSDAPAHEISEKIESAFKLHIQQQKMRWTDAYREMLITQFNIPDSLISTNEVSLGLFLMPGVMERYRAPSWDQFRYRCRQLKNLSPNTQIENPRGKRGKVRDGVPGPGFYEIDATFFQIQLVSRITSGLLVGRPLVYLIVDTFDGMITGYSVSLENPSWAVAALALHNCFTDKGSVFERLGLPYKSEDWPSHHLPALLRADRAEFVSNHGQEFPTSGIKVEVTPSMTPEAKGTVEGKNSEIKKLRGGRFNLPGRFNKKLERRQSNGKKEAALDIFTFEKILVEIIMDINGEPVNPRSIPPDAMPFGAKVASRTGLHKWGLEHRAGFTRNMPPNFLFEHLLKTANATVTPLGLQFKNELYHCDRLRELGLLYEASKRTSKIKISFNPNLASEIYFFDYRNSTWTPAFNTDPEIYQIKASFAEAMSYRTNQRLLTEQAGLNNHAKRRIRIPAIKSSIKNCLHKKNEDKIHTSSSRAKIRENRAIERARERYPMDNSELGIDSAAPPTRVEIRPPRSPDDELWDEVSDR